MDTYALKEKKIGLGRWMAQLVDCSLHKHEDLGLMPSSYMKDWAWGHALETPALKNLSGLVSKPQVPSRNVVSKHKMEG